VADLSRLRLFNAHRAERDLSQSGPVELDDYHEFLVSSCVETLELSVWLDGTLIGVAIVDRGQHSLNAMYTFFDPNLGRYCVGTLAVLKQVQYARETGRDYVYLGLYVADNSHLNYKARFRPQQRRIDGAWRWIDAECGSMQNNAAPV
jgi:arginine-tRNA-protein transferase